MIEKFDKSKLFYPYILNYISTYHGLLEMVSRTSNAIIKQEIDKNSEENILEQIKELPEDDTFRKLIESGNYTPTELLGKLQFKSSERGDIPIDIEKLSKDFFDDYQSLINQQIKAAGVLIIMAYELSKGHAANNKSNELWNFFYHCRNAAAHGGSFNITNMNRFPAKWGTLEIDASMNGTSLFKDLTGVGFILPGDPVFLLYDIEQLYL